MMASTTNIATAPGVNQLAQALDEAIAALTSLDAPRLEGIESTVSGMLDGVNAQTFFGSIETELPEITARHRLLGSLVASTELNLAVLQRLHARIATGEAAWVR